MKREPSSAGGVLGLAAAGMVVCCGITTLASAGAVAAVGGWLTNSAVVGVGLLLAVIAVWLVLRARRKERCVAPEREPVGPASPDESSRPW